MKYLFTVLLSLITLCGSLQAQRYGDALNLRTGENDVTRVDLNRVNPSWAPFYHGVASGDPLEDRVIIWTRVTPDTINEQDITVDWQVATDARLENIVQSGSTTTNADVDYTVKIDITGLQAGTTYYYGFTAMGRNSLTGRTKTTPTGATADHLRFGVVSCSNFTAGFFNGYQQLARHNDLDAVLHLGDYIYEYGANVYGNLDSLRPLEPATEILSTGDYRLRYSTYRLDTMLARVHQQHPFITVWDDHESANDSYVDGAENHTDSLEGDWETRKAIARDVYFEWLPIRDNEAKEVYRTIKYGDIADLIMLDTRLAGREMQILTFGDTALFNPQRTILGAEQKAWFFDQLANSTAKWKIVGQQVIFSEFNVGWAALGLQEVDPTATFAGLEGLFQDIWDGYPAERSQVIGYIEEQNIENVVFLTGDFHSTFAFDVADQPVTLSFLDVPGVGTVPVYSPNENYNAVTGEGTVAVEFATPSITSANFDENLSADLSAVVEAQINTVLEPIPGFPLGNPNPHMIYTDLDQHGFFILDVKLDSVQADWYFTPIMEVTDSIAYGAGYYTYADSLHLHAAAVAASGKEQQDEPAPANPPMATDVDDVLTDQATLSILGTYPNPFSDVNTLHFAVHEATQLNISLFDINGKLVRTLKNQRVQPGVYTVQLNATDLAEGTYFYHVRTNKKTYTAKVVLMK